MQAGDPVFPRGETDGINVRDWFAAKAMDSIITWHPRQNALDRPSQQVSRIVRLSYEFSDAMIVESNK